MMQQGSVKGHDFSRADWSASQAPIGASAPEGNVHDAEFSAAKAANILLEPLFRHD
jgi:hypothetical protein